MIRNVALTVCLLSACVWCLMLVARADSAQDAPKTFKPVAPIESLMEGQEVQFEQIGELIADKEVRFRTNKIRLAGELLAEFANVNIYHVAKEDYQGWATKVRDLSMALAEEAKKRRSADEDKMKELVKQIETNCNACHDVYP